MQSDHSTRQSIALGTTVLDANAQDTDESRFSEQLLQQHSFDLLLFPRYLQRNVPAHVRIEVVEDASRSPQLMALFHDRGEQATRFALLHADEDGVATDSDAFFHEVHAAFAAAAGPSRYLGFPRFGPPPYAPLFALALLYRRYGRGLYLPGDVLPTPWPGLQAGYQARC